MVIPATVKVVDVKYFEMYQSCVLKCIRTISSSHVRPSRSEFHCAWNVV